MQGRMEVDEFGRVRRSDGRPHYDDRRARDQPPRDDRYRDRERRPDARPPSRHPDEPMSLRQFAASLNPPLPEAEANLAYERYLTRLGGERAAIFFEQHKSEEWFQQKYNPALRAQLEEPLVAHAKAAVAQFEGDLTSAALSSLKLDAPETPAGLVTFEDEDGSCGLLRTIAAPTSAQPSEYIIFFKAVPPSVTQRRLEELLGAEKGFLRLEFGEAQAARRFHRPAWAFFDAAVTGGLPHVRIEEARATPAARYTSTAYVNGAAVAEARKRIDATQAAAVIAALDARRGVACPIAPLPADLSALPASELTRQLDLRLLYLRRVHLFDYYSCSQLPSQAALVHRAGEQSLRLPLPPSPEAAERWARELDRRLAAVVAKPLSQDDVRALGGRDEEQETTAFLEANTAKIDEGRFRCCLCSKLFKGADFVHKHLRTKHPVEVAGAAQLLNTFLADPDRPMPPVRQPAPAHQQHQPPPPQPYERPSDGRRPHDDRRAYDDRRPHDDRRAYDDRRPYDERRAYDDRRRRYDERPPRPLVSYADVGEPPERLAFVDYRTALLL